MRRDVMIRKLCESTKKQDVIIFGNKSMASEAFDLYRPGYFFVDDCCNLTLPLALGIAMGTDKRVFVFVNETDVIRNFGILNQISSVRKQNLFVIIFNTKESTVFNSGISINSTIFSIGCRIFDLTSDFDKKRFTQIKHFFDRGQGPMVVILEVDKSKEIDLEPKNNFEEFVSFVTDTSIKTALYNPFADGLVLPGAQEDSPTLQV